MGLDIGCFQEQGVQAGLCPIVHHRALRIVTKNCMRVRRVLLQLEGGGSSLVIPLFGLFEVSVFQQLASQLLPEDGKQEARNALFHC